MASLIQTVDFCKNNLVFTQRCHSASSNWIHWLCQQKAPRLVRRKWLPDPASSQIDARTTSRLDQWQGIRRKRARSKWSNRFRLVCVRWWRNGESRKHMNCKKATDRKDSKSFFNELKNVCGPKSSGTTPIPNANESSLLTDKGKILERWAEHFNNVLNFSSIVSDEALDEIVQLPVLYRHRCRKYRKLLDRCAQEKQLDHMAFLPFKLQIQRTKTHQKTHVSILQDMK